jgi:hypothetical protein
MFPAPNARNEDVSELPVSSRSAAFATHGVSEAYFRSFERRRSARTLPPVWHCGQ